MHYKLNNKCLNMNHFRIKRSEKNYIFVVELFQANSRGIVLLLKLMSESQEASQ